MRCSSQRRSACVAALPVAYTDSHAFRQSLDQQFLLCCINVQLFVVDVHDLLEANAGVLVCANFCCFLLQTAEVPAPKM